MKSFQDLQPEAFSDAVVLVDIDGTLTHERGKELDAEILSKLKALGEVAEVHLCSVPWSVPGALQLPRS